MKTTDQLLARLKAMGYTEEDLDRSNPYTQHVRLDPVPESVDECEFGQDEYQWRLRQAGL